MEKLIDVVNKLQDTFSQLNISCPFDLPQIAVVGEQSAGKSSVLENFVGKDFLPRGSGIVTRRPLILQLIYSVGQEYGEFLHNMNKKYTNFLEIREEIMNETDRITGKNKNISNVPINLRIYSPHVLNLTLIDLPGLTKNPVGDQPKDIEKQIREMLLEYISNPNCLILAVTPAIIDLANSEALQIAREVDPNGLRTIGVITKIDMMDQGTDCLDVLDNKVYFLRRGYVGIVNRNQRDIDTKKSIALAQESEIRFFRDHPKYRSVSERMGTKFLQKTLNAQLSEHIKGTLPQLRQSIVDEMMKLQGVMDSNPELFDQATMESGSKSHIVMIKIQNLSREIDSCFGYLNEVVNLEEESPGSKIAVLMGQRFFYEIERVKPSDQDIRRDIRIAILNAQGIRQSLFSAGAPFMAVIKHYLKETESPCLLIIEMVTQEIRKVVHDIVSRIFSSYPDLLSEILTFADGKINLTNRTAREYAKFFVCSQADHINTNHPDFMSSQNCSGEKSSTSTQHQITGMENMIYKEGILFFGSSNSLKANKEYFATLRGQTLIVFKNSTKKNLRDQMFLADCKFKDASSRNKFMIVISKRDGSLLTRSNKTLDLICSSAENCEEWKAALVGAGLEFERGVSEPIINEDDEFTPDSKNSEFDSDLAKQIEYVFMLVNSYMKITSKILQDITSKIIVRCIINEVRTVLYADLVTHLFSTGIESYMSESSEAKHRRETVFKMHRSCKDALQIINSFTITEGSAGMEMKKYQKQQNDSFRNHQQPRSVPNNNLIRPQKAPSDISVERTASSQPTVEAVRNREMQDSAPPQVPTAPKLAPTQVKKPKRPSPKATSQFYS